MPHHPREAAGQALEYLEEFFAEIEEHGLPDLSPDGHALRRRLVVEALARLLAEGREVLEERRDTRWPYRKLQEAADLLAKAALSGGETGRQAGLYLALLPVPGQWSRLNGLEAAGSLDGEVTTFLQAEEAKLVDKLRRKPDTEFKLRHFLQILKPPRPGEKGVLRIFSLPALVTVPGLAAALGLDWVLYVEPPMGLVFRHTYWRRLAPATAGPEEAPVLFGLCGPEDREWIAGQEWCLPVPIAHSDYLPPEPLPEGTDGGAKEFDLVFNSDFGDLPRKRHHLMLEILARPELAGTTALLLGRDDDRGADLVRQAAAAMGLGDRVTVLADLKREEVPRQLARCRAAVHLGMYENGPRVVYEFFRADLPVVCSALTSGIDPAHFSPRTGLMVPDTDLSRAIAWTLANLSSFSPRQWFLEESGSRNSSLRLNTFLREFFAARGWPWSEDIRHLASGGANRHADPADYRALLPEYERLLKVFRQHGRPGVRLTVEG